VNRFTSNQEQNDPRPILQISSIKFHQQERVIFATFLVCHIPFIDSELERYVKFISVLKIFSVTT